MFLQMSINHALTEAIEGEREAECELGSQKSLQLSIQPHPQDLQPLSAYMIYLAIKKKAPIASKQKLQEPETDPRMVQLK